MNAFRGTVEGGYVRVGGDLLPHERTDLSDGQPVVAYARPHDTEIVADAGDAKGILARVNRVLANGGISRVELIANGVHREGAKEYFEVEVGSDQLTRLALSAGQNVRLTSRRLSLFPDQTAGKAP